MPKKDDLRPHPYEEYDPKYPHYQYKLNRKPWIYFGIAVAILISMFLIGAYL